ncbi:MAG: SDR family oxidoreductase [Gammaproteobacteria bacterium]
MVNELFDVRGKVVLITGGSRGIGHMMARGFVAAGARVYITSRKAEQCTAAAKELAREGECYALPGDLARMEEIERVTAELAAREPALHVLINNAGTQWGATIDEFPEKGWDKVMDLNAKSPFFILQKLLPLLEAAARPEDPARVINVSSVDGMHTPIFQNFSYAASKAALNHLSRMLASHLAPRNITVNVIAPGPFHTDMLDPMVQSMGEDTVLANVPLKRMGNGDDAAGVAIFLASRASAYVTGTVVPMDGGIFGAT